MQYNEDDRAQRLLDVFPEMSKGQINVSYINSTSHIVAWHKHEIQTDYWICLKGSIKVGLGIPTKGFDGEEIIQVRWAYISDKNPRVIKIPPGVHHGYRALEPNSILMYYLTERYNPDDECRSKPGDFGENWETENK